MAISTFLHLLMLEFKKTYILVFLSLTSIHFICYSQTDSLSFQKKSIMKRENLNIKNSAHKVLPDSSSKQKLNSDSLRSEVKSKMRGTDFGSKVKKIIPSGSISLGYDYGFLPYTVNMPSPASAYKTEGVVGLDILNIPLDVTWFYSSQKNLIGLNNYFRISYNVDRYKDKLNSNLSNNIDSYKNKLGGLNAKRQDVMQKMAYSDYLSSISPDKWPIDTTSLKTKIIVPGSFNTSTLTSLDEPNVGTYTTSVKVPSYTSKSDSLIQVKQNYKHKVDSVKDAYYAYKSQYDQINDSIANTKKKIEELESFRSGDPKQYLGKVPYYNRAQNVLSGIRKLEIGLCYPSHSTFLVSNIPVRGVNLEYSKKKGFFAFTYGTTVNTMLYSNRNVEGFLYNVRNSYNYFDFNNTTAGRKIISAKFGIGSKEDNHLFAGFLVGKGKNSYLPSLNESSTSNNVESNLIVELDARCKIGRSSSFDIIMGKSSIKDEDLNFDFIQRAMQEIISPYRSFALLTKFSTKLDLTNSSISASFRWVDPFFKSFGVGFIRSDNMRYEIKLDQPLSKKLKYTGMFRYEEDNLLRLMSYKNHFYSFSNTITYRIKRGLMVRVGYTPLFRTLTTEGSSITNKNSITNCILTYMPRTRKVNMQFNALYNYYLVNTDTSQLNFQNVAYYHQIQFKNGFKTGFNGSWFRNSLQDSTNNNVILSMLDMGYDFKGGSSVSVGGKCAYKLNGTLYPGFIAKINLKLFRSLYWENQVEKFIVGDLFNGYDLYNLQKFPYYCSTKLTFNF